MRTYTEIIGTTTTTSPTLYPGSFSTLSNNNSAPNVALASVLANNEHRYLLQKYFDNERAYTTVTIGAEDLTLTGTLLSGATSASLSAVWPNISCQELVTFSNSDQRTVFFTQGSASIRWQTGLSAIATASITTIGVQAYPIPPQVSKIKNDTITVGQLVYTPAPVQTIQEWTMLNALPYTSDIPNYFYIYNNQVNFWPIPSTSGNIITFNYKARVPDLSFVDYSTGTLSGIATGSNSITGASTSWNTTGTYPLNTDLTFFNLFLKITPPKGEGIWYQIQSFQSDTALTLIQPIQNAPSTTATAYVIGQMPLLQEDFHDMLVCGPLMVYYSAIVKDKERYAQFKNMYDIKLMLLEAYAGTKSVNVDLGSQPIPNNPNLFIYAPNQ